MLNAAWIEREAPLDQCPLAACRRSKTCHYPTDRNPCRRLHETKEEMRMELAAKLEALTAEARRRDPEGKNWVPDGSPEHERRLKILKQMLWQADHDDWQRQKAEAARARREAGQPPPETGG
jgi:hypothetical protein